MKDLSESMGGPPSSGDHEQRISVLLVEADELAAERLFEVLRAPGPTRFDVTLVPTVEEALERLQEAEFDVLLIDLSIEDGLESLYRARIAANAVPIVVLTYRDDQELALRAARAGAQDYLIKGEVTPALITRSLVHAVERHRMVMELRDAQQRHHFLATHDPLTGLRNRYSLLDSLRSSISDAARNQTRLAVLFIDLDGFKPVNDNLGHAMGDELLADVARRLKRTIRKSDHVARLGGDEFVAVIRNITDDQTVDAVAEQVRSELTQTFHVGDVETWISASIGIATYPEHGGDPDALIQRADTAMYQAKSEGRNAIVVFRDEMEEEVVDRFQLVNSLRGALHAGEMELDFQPQIDAISERISGVETLIRWNHPTRGIVGPAEFVRIAEETGLMVPIGEWVLRKACETAASWTELPDIRVAVNVSGRQLQQAEFADRVALILQEAGFPGSRLELELTESVAAADGSLAALGRLRKLGIRVAIDDFGTGYSSLKLLKRLDADILKIDRSFVHDAAKSQAASVIVEGMVQMARGLGMEVIAEGVETLEEMDQMLALGCQYMQGYLFSKPIPKDRFEEEATSESAPWRMPVQRPESWSPPSVDALRADEARESEATPRARELGDEYLPALRRD